MDLLGFMQSHGYIHAAVPPAYSSSPSDRFRRFPAEGKDKTNRSGWAVWAVPEKICVFGDWVTGQKHTWIDGGNRKLTKGERHAVRESMKAIRKEEAEYRQTATRQMRQAFESAKPAKAHSYLAAKHVRPHNTRIGDRGDLLIPLFNIDGELTSVQKIWRKENGGFEKRYGSGCTKRGTFCPLGDIGTGDKLLIAEGFATAATIFEVTGIPTAAAMDAGNLSPVAAVFREKYPKLQIIIAADDDTFSESGNTGVAKATKAAEDYGCSVIIPDFTGTERGEGTDFNDLFKSLNYDQVELKNRIETAIEAIQGAQDACSTEASPDTNTSLVYAAPAGFFVDDTGVYQVGDDGERIRISDFLLVAGVGKDANGGVYSRIVDFVTTDNIRKTLIFPMKLISQKDASNVLALLYDSGFNGLLGRQRTKFLDYLLKSDPQKQFVTTVKTGWFDNSYVMPDAVFGSDSIIYTGSADTGFVFSGILRDWKQHIAAKAIGNSRLVFGISLAFTSVIMPFLGIETTGFHFWGASSKGKTTILQVAASVFGDDGLMKQWLATANGLEGVALAHNNAMFCLDELSQAEPKMAYDTAYRLANQKQKARADRLGNARQTDSWRLFYLSSGELPFKRYLESGNLRLKAGQSVRLIDVRACPDEACGAFENAGGDSKEFVSGLKQAVTQYYGTAARQFVKNIVCSTVLDTLKAVGRQQVKHFAERLRNGRNFGDQARRVTDVFAAIAFGGTLATRLGVTGWAESEAFDGVRACFEDWLSDRGTQDLEDMQIIESIVNFIHESGHRIVWSDAVDNGLKRDVVGYCIGLQQKRYAFTTKGFQEVIGDHDVMKAANLLKKLGVLIHERGRLQQRERVAPVGKQVPYYVVSDKIFDVHQTLTEDKIDDG